MFRFRSLKLKAIRPLFICLIFLFIFNLVIATVLEEHADALYVGAAPSGEQKIIILDAGHGGEDCGAIGIDGVLEKDLNLAITFELGRMLGEKNFAVIYTRTEDKLLYRPDQDIKGIRKISDLKNRCEIAKKYPEALFISIHMNKFTQEKYSGTQIYSSINNKESRKLAETIQAEIKNTLQPQNNRKVKDGDSIYLLKNTSNVAILIECGFLSNRDECKKLSEKEYQKQLSFSIVCGIIEYIGK